eukprot:g2522.t1
MVVLQNKQVLLRLRSVLPKLIRNNSSAAATKPLLSPPWSQARHSKHPMSSIWAMRENLRNILSSKNQEDVSVALKNILESDEKLSNQNATTIMRILGNHKDSKAMHKILEKIDGSIDTKTYLSAMKASIHSGEPSEALTFFEKLDDSQKGEKLMNGNDATCAFDWKIAAHAANGDSKSAMETLSTMAEAGVERSLTSFNFAMEACVNGKDDKSAEEVLNLMTESSIWPNRETHCHLISCYSKTEKWKQVIQVADSMDLLKFRPSQEAGLLILKAHAMLKDNVGAQVTFDNLKRKGLLPTQEIFKTLMTVCAEAKDWERALFYFEVSGRKVKPDDESFRVARKALHEGFKEGLFGERQFQNYVQTLGLGTSEQVKVDLKYAQELYEAAEKRVQELKR